MDSQKEALYNASPGQRQELISNIQLKSWENNVKHCAYCGYQLLEVPGHLHKYCGQCQKEVFPEYSVAISVAIRKDDLILLARSPHFPKGRYSAIAGFIDFGESAEDAVAREVKEEVGVEVKNVRYIGSQPWPFPNSYMIGFVAEWSKGDINIDDDEIEDAQWFSVQNLPDLPSSASLSRALIDRVIHDISFS